MIRVGIDLGGTNIVAGVVDDHYTILATAKRKTNLPRPADDIISDMAAVAKEAVEKANMTMQEVRYIGVGCPGTCNQETGIVEYSNNLRFDKVPLKEKLEELTGKPVCVENDANAAALGEALAGAGKGAKSCVCITLGTGVGSGVVLDGKVYDGFNFAAAEIGHTVIVVDGEPCTCGRHGCWEAYASATALVRQTKAAMQKHPDSQMHNVAREQGRVNGRTAFDAMRRGDAAAKQVVDTYIRYIACGLANVVNIFQPEVLCIGGGICNEGDTLLIPLKEMLEQERYSKYSERQTRLCVATLANDAGIIGAAFLGDE